MNLAVLPHVRNLPAMIIIASKNTLINMHEISK